MATFETRPRPLTSAEAGLMAAEISHYRPYRKGNFDAQGLLRVVPKDPFGARMVLWSDRFLKADEKAFRLEDFDHDGFGHFALSDKNSRFTRPAVVSPGELRIVRTHQSRRVSQGGYIFGQDSDRELFLDALLKAQRGEDPRVYTDRFFLRTDPSLVGRSFGWVEFNDTNDQSYRDAVLVDPKNKQLIGRENSAVLHPDNFGVRIYGSFNLNDQQPASQPPTTTHPAMRP